MKILSIFAIIWASMIAFSFVEAYVEGRNAGDKGKLGPRVMIGRYNLTAYHFWLFYVMFPLLMILPFVVFHWDAKLFGVVMSAFCTGVIIEDFMWYVINPVVKVKELWSDFSNYYPWIKLAGKKIIPVVYIGYGTLATLFWFFLWR
jgi:hypothetical protein